jgi:hypothetical protein
MTARWLVVPVLLLLVCLPMGCNRNNDNQAVEPKLAPESKIDPRIQRAGDGPQADPVDSVQPNK